GETETPAPPNISASPRLKPPKRRPDCGRGPLVVTVPLCCVEPQPIVLQISGLLMFTRSSQAGPRRSSGPTGSCAGRASAATVTPFGQTAVPGVVPTRTASAAIDEAPGGASTTYFGPRCHTVGFLNFENPDIVPRRRHSTARAMSPLSS